MKGDEAAPLKSLARPGRSMSTLRRWCELHRISRQPGGTGRVEVSRVALAMVEAGEMETLEIFRAGNRDHPAVRRFFDLLGLPV